MSRLAYSSTHKILRLVFATTGETIVGPPVKVSTLRGREILRVGSGTLLVKDRSRIVHTHL